MRRAQRLEEFAGAPIGRFAVGTSWLAWCAAPDLGGTVLWRRPTERDAAELVQVWEYDRALPGRFDVVSDLARVTTVDAAPFERLVAYVAGRRADYDARVRRHALVRPSGLSGAAVAGFNELIAPRFEWRVASTDSEAFAWLERRDAAAVRDSVARLVDDAAGVAVDLAALRGHLTANPLLDVAAAATAMKQSTRTLQRRLREAGTSFRAEVTRARLEVARTLLATSDEKLDVVARRAGLASASQLARLFKRLLGESPGDVRRRARSSSRAT